MPQFPTQEEKEERLNNEFLESNKREFENYKKNKYKYYEVLVASDDRTCEKCIQFSGKILEVKEAKMFINFPPFHKGCRCTTVAYFDDDDLNN